MPTAIRSRPSIQTTAISRRQWLHALVAAGLGGAIASRSRAAGAPRLKVAAVYTEMSYRSHAHVILENFLEPYYFNGKVQDSGCDIVSIYADQIAEKRDLTQMVSKAYQIPVYSTISEALTRGGKQLAVDAVLSIGEHGKYPLNAKGQREYPRKRFFDEIVQVFKQSGKVVPVFTDKHLSYRWDWASEMVDTARQMKIPLMAGSSVPLAQRQPVLELPAQVRLDEAVATHGGGLDSYDFHGLEVLQSMVEARAGGETGIESVQYLGHEALWQAAQAGTWSPSLVLAALKTDPTLKVTEADLRAFTTWGLQLRYRDGLKGMVVKTLGNGTRWHFACRVQGEQQARATSFNAGPWQNRCLFKALSHAIQAHFHQGKAPYPIERTLLTTGMVEAGVESHHRGDTVYPTPHLGITYQPIDYRPMREMGESWNIISEKTAEPQGYDHLGKPSSRMAQLR